MLSRNGLTDLTNGFSFSHANRYGSSSGVSLGLLGLNMSCSCHAKLITLSKRNPTSITASNRPNYGSSHMVRHACS